MNKATTPYTVPFLSLAILLLTASVAGASPNVNDPTQVVGHEACAKCHQNEVQTWSKTPHSTTFTELQRKPEAKQIADRMGLKSIKRGELCIQCHYTMQAERGKAKPIAGVSCESCHGAAKQWLTIHNDYGGPDVTKQAETPEHRQQRLHQSISLGMRNPLNLYLVARSCYNCHTVPHEQLVNVGGHTAGSQDFELVAWSQGMVRHNFLRTEGTSNATSSPARLRVMYVVGLMTDLEFSLRAIAQATVKEKFGVTMAGRAAVKKKKLLEIQASINNADLQHALQAVATVELTLNNQQEILAAADQVSAAANAFAQRADGSALAGIDPLLPNPAQYK